MRKVLMVLVVTGLMLGLSNIGFATVPERITIDACSQLDPGCTNGRSGPDYQYNKAPIGDPPDWAFGEYRSVDAGTYNISVVAGAWGTQEITDFNPPNDVYNEANDGQFWLWSLAIYNGVDYFMLGDHSVSGAAVYHPWMSTLPYYTSKTGAQAAALAHNFGDSIEVSTTGDLWFYVYDPKHRDNEGSLTFDVAVVPEPVSTTLFIIGGVVLGGRSYIRRKRSIV